MHLKRIVLLVSLLLLSNNVFAEKINIDDWLKNSVIALDADAASSSDGLFPYTTCAVASCTHIPVLPLYELVPLLKNYYNGKSYGFRSFNRFYDLWFYDNTLSDSADNYNPDTLDDALWGVINYLREHGIIYLGGTHIHSAWRDGPYAVPMFYASMLRTQELAVTTKTIGEAVGDTTYTAPLSDYWFRPCIVTSQDQYKKIRDLSVADLPLQVYYEYYSPSMSHASFSHHYYSAYTDDDDFHYYATPSTRWYEGICYTGTEEIELTSENENFISNANSSEEWPNIESILQDTYTDKGRLFRQFSTTVNTYGIEYATDYKHTCQGCGNGQCSYDGEWSVGTTDGLIGFDSCPYSGHNVSQADLVKPNWIINQSGCPSVAEHDHNKNKVCVIKKKICFSNPDDYENEFNLTESIGSTSSVITDTKLEWPVILEVTGDVNACGPMPSSTASTEGKLTAALTADYSGVKKTTIVSSQKSSLFIGSKMPGILKVSNFILERNKVPNANILVENTENGRFAFTGNDVNGFGGYAIYVYSGGNGIVNNNKFTNDGYPITARGGHAEVTQNSFVGTTGLAVRTIEDGTATVKENGFYNSNGYAVYAERGKIKITGNEFGNTHLFYGSENSYLDIENNDYSQLNKSTSLLNLTGNASAKVKDEDLTMFNTYSIATTDEGSVVFDGNIFSGKTPLIYGYSCQNLGAIRNNAFKEKMPEKLITFTPQAKITNVFGNSTLCESHLYQSFKSLEKRDEGLYKAIFETPYPYYGPKEITDVEIYLDNKRILPSIGKSTFTNNCSSTSSGECYKYSFEIAIPELDLQLISNAGDGMLTFIFNSGDKLAGISKIDISKIIPVNVALFDDLYDKAAKECVGKYKCCESDTTCKDRCATVNACIDFMNDPNGLSSKDYSNGGFFENRCYTNDSCSLNFGNYSISKYPSAYPNDGSGRLTCNEYQQYQILSDTTSASGSSKWSFGTNLFTGRAYSIYKCALLGKIKNTVGRLRQTNPLSEVIDPRTIMMKEPGNFKITPKTGPDPLINPGMTNDTMQQMIRTINPSNFNAIDPLRNK